MNGAAVIDAPALTEFLDKAEAALGPSFLADLSASLEQRRGKLPGDLTDAAWWRLAPVGRRVPPPERTRWTPVLAAWRDELAAGDAEAVLSRMAALPDCPQWLVDWATFWCHVTRPANPWWARWVYSAQTGTGALLLVVDDPRLVVRPTLSETYREMRRLADFMGAVLDSTGRLRDVSPSFRPMVALALVYGVYLFTMASWRMTREFTEILPPLPAVVKTLLGATRWEGSRLGTEG